jgi:hypothetical protein
MGTLSLTRAATSSRVSMKRPCAEGPGRAISVHCGQSSAVDWRRRALGKRQSAMSLYMSAGQEFLVVYRLGSVSVRLCGHVVGDYIPIYLCASRIDTESLVQCH